MWLLLKHPIENTENRSITTIIIIIIIIIIVHEVFIIHKWSLIKEASVEYKSSEILHILPSLTCSQLFF